MPYTDKFQPFEDIIREIMVVYKHDERPWLIGYSGGKDSTLLVCLVYEAMLRLKAAGAELKKKIYVITSDTMVENPNKINVPYIIDTPFARIDKEHRTKILEQFFKKLNGQIIILSTDEEIVGEYKETVSDVISNTFMLNHTAQGNTEIISDLYFGG